MRDYYSILGLSEHATHQQIKSAFRKLCMQYHPDKTGGNKSLEEKFRQILAAYETLGDPALKYNYDERRAWQRKAAAEAAQRPQPAPAPRQYNLRREYPQSGAFATDTLVSTGMPKKVVIITATLFAAFFILLYFFGPKPRPPYPLPERSIALPPVTSGLFPKVTDTNPLLELNGNEIRLKDFLAGRDSSHSFVNMDADEIPELVAGNYLFATGENGRYRLIFRYEGAMYVQYNQVFLYFNDLVGAYRSCYRCAVERLPNDESIAEIRMVYDSGKVVFPGQDKHRTIAILENLQYLFNAGIPPLNEEGNDDGTRKELLRHFIAFHFNGRNRELTRTLFEKLYAEKDKEQVGRDLEEMISILEKRITSATVFNSDEGY